MSFFFFKSVIGIITREASSGIRCVNDHCLRTFVPIATAHPYSAHKFTCHNHASGARAKD